MRCFLFQFYIKPQLIEASYRPSDVVSYFNSTSNHNVFGGSFRPGQVVSYFNSTSNHNDSLDSFDQIELFLISILHQTTTKLQGRQFRPVLFLISILHQTTTREASIMSSLRLFLISILHQTTTFPASRMRRRCCFLFQFYIKPQQQPEGVHFPGVVSYFNSTSNHNYPMRCGCLA